MQDLPPPSYDDAISGAYPSSSTKQEQQELTTFSPSAPLAPPSPEPSTSPEPQTPRSSSISLKNKCVRTVLCTVLILVVIAVMATVIKDIIPSPISNCKKAPKIGRGLSSKQHCEENYRGEYWDGSWCVYECTEPNYVIYRYSPFKGDLTKLNYNCTNSKWIPSVGSVIEPYFVGSAHDDFSCGERPSRTWDDCKGDLPNIFNARWVKCPRNGHYERFGGTECKFKCPSDTTLYVYGSDQVLKSGPVELSYTCKNSKWVPSFINKKFQCIPTISSPKYDCTTEPENVVPGAISLDDCPRRNHHLRNSPYGTKCRFACGYIYRGGPQGFVENDSGIITYTCNTSNWVSSVGEAEKNWQCLGRGAASGLSGQPYIPDYCTDKPPNITGAHWTHCPKNSLGQYFDGTKCSYSCDGDNVLSVLYKSRGSYICTKNEWVPAPGVNNQNIDCV